MTAASPKPSHGPFDGRSLSKTWPQELRRATEIAASLRHNPIALKIVEGLTIAQAREGDLSGFTDPTALAYVGEKLLPKYKSAVADLPQDLIDSASLAGWKASPLTTALTLSQDFDPAPHLRVISDAIVNAVNGKGPRFIIVSMPPRYGKSNLISRYTSEWFMANWPDKNVGICGYGSEFASTWGRLCRNQLLDNEARFGFGVAPDSSAADYWHTTLGGSLWTAGIGGQITGKGADLLICDDAIKDWESAISLVNREKIQNWWLSTARSRLSVGAVCIVVGTRWHSSDLSGFLLAGEDKDSWLEINLPVVWDKDYPDLLGRKKGNLLWPGRFDAAEVEATRRSVGAEVFNALYMQQPLDLQTQGRVYHAFDEKSHIRENMRDERLPICASFDFNHDPMSVVIAQYREEWAANAHLTNEKRIEIEVLDEISLPDSNTQAACEELHQRLRKLMAGSRGKVHIFGDASGRQMKSSATKSDWEIVRKSFSEQAHYYSAAYFVPDSNCLVRDRTNAVNTMCRNSAGDVRLFVDPKCKQLLTDLHVCRWKRDSNGGSTSQIDKSDPKRSHMSDALGYLIYARRAGRQVYGEIRESPR